MHRYIYHLACGFALLGGITLAALILLVGVSVLGRSLNGVLHSDTVEAFAPALTAWLLSLGIGPVNGDFEILEAGMAFAIFAFLPICQLTGSHASVDVFASRLPVRLRETLRLLAEIAFAAALILLAWQLTLGGLSKYRSGQTTLLLEFPAWWSYAASIVAMWAAALTAVCVAWFRLAERLGGRPFPAFTEGPPP